MIQITGIGIGIVSIARCQRGRSERAAFTLFELLLVLGIITILAVIAVPSFSSIQRSTALTRAEDELVGELSLARQHAISVNREVEVRLYRHKDSSMPGVAAMFRSFQSFTYNESGEATPLRIMRTLPKSVIIDSGTTLSSLLGSSRKKSWLGSDTQPRLPGLALDYEAYAFRFRPDGSTDLAPFPTAPWFFTLHDIAQGDNLSKPPANYSSIVVDPVSGQPASFRP